jgi:hypothetical protein
MLITEIGMAQLPVLLYRLGASLTDLRRSVCGQYVRPFPMATVVKRGSAIKPLFSPF